MGKPTKEEKTMDKVKEATKLVDDAFDNPSEFKKAGQINEAYILTDKILESCGPSHNKKKKEVEEVENKIDHVPEQEPYEHLKDVRDEMSKDNNMALESAVSIIDMFMQEKEMTRYQKFFKKMLKNWGVKSPAELPKEKKKKFFNAVDKAWKSEKEKD